MLGSVVRLFSPTFTSTKYHMGLLINKVGTVYKENNNIDTFYIW
jgi:hypothetical protein